ncbi:titin-like [Oreochromis niloticus]|uniref:titin-like n=1 Tax=Oreochromis niloticus TaxID=8128 RepID=UPI000DF18D5F|nr:titin-like [Oreochromis niloticus]
MRGNEANRVISVSQGGLYHCRGGRGDPVYYTEDSSDVTVTETLPSKPTVTLQPSWTQIYSGETVTVRCEIQGGEGAQWTYEWRAAKLNTPPTSNEHRIIRATESDSGGYSCRGRRDYFFSEWSDIITLTVSSSKPRVTLTAQSSVIPAGGSVTLSCSVEGSAGWKFDWFRRVDSARLGVSWRLARQRDLPSWRWRSRCAGVLPEGGMLSASAVCPAASEPRLTSTPAPPPLLAIWVAIRPAPVLPLEARATARVDTSPSLGRDMGHRRSGPIPSPARGVG